MAFPLVEPLVEAHVEALRRSCFRETYGSDWESFLSEGQISIPPCQGVLCLFPCGPCRRPCRHPCRRLCRCPSSGLRQHSSMVLHRSTRTMNSKNRLPVHAPLPLKSPLSRTSFPLPFPSCNFGEDPQQHKRVRVGLPTWSFGLSGCKSPQIS